MASTAVGTRPFRAHANPILRVIPSGNQQVIVDKNQSTIANRAPK
ncbi:hypothetical protein [Robbsia andropogonis]|nr:hypothetical protein [Robbsia andropogonis]